MSGGGGDGGGQFTTNPWPGAGTGGGPSVPGGGPAGGGQGGGAPGQEVCEALVFEARLRNVDSDELAHVNIGDVLTVVFESNPAPHVAVFRRMPDGGLAGTPVGALVERLVELLPCLEILEFESEVLEIDGGNTRVRVRPA